MPKCAPKTAHERGTIENERIVNLKKYVMNKMQFTPFCATLVNC